MKSTKKPLVSFDTLLVVLLAVITMATVPYLHARLDPGDYTPAIGYGSEAQTERNTSAAARLLGEIRTSLSDFMFLKTEHYVHNGVAYHSHITEKDLLPEADRGEHLHVDTLIRSATNDWRGIVGFLERAIKPYRPPEHHMPHDKGKELLPWFRLMTMVNPHRIRGYRIGAFLLLGENNPHAFEMAYDFISEGLHNNPESHEMYFMMMRLKQHEMRYQMSQANRLSATEEQRYLEETLDYALQGVHYGAKHRPEGGWVGKGRPAEMEDSFAACLHYVVLIQRRLGRNDEALQNARDYLTRFGADPILETEIKELSELLELPLPNKPDWRPSEQNELSSDKESEK